MEARLVREELQKCYRGEGVNHLKNCKELADLYTRMIRDNKVSSPARTNRGWSRGDKRSICIQLAVARRACAERRCSPLRPRHSMDCRV